MDEVKNQLHLRLKKTFKHYICHALEHALNEPPSESDILQAIINMQSALELLSKSFILQQEGWRRVIASKYHDLPTEEILTLIGSGMIKTSSYQENKEYISEKLSFNEYDKKLLKKFQGYRNQVMHLGMTRPSAEIIGESILLMARIINRLGWRETLPILDQYGTNCLEKLIGKSLYKKLIDSPYYVGDSVDRAYDSYYDELKHCLECGNESWLLNDNSEELDCFVCGYRGDIGMFGFINCPLCDAKNEVAYDALNIAENEYIRGKCCSCRSFINVAMCKTCEEVSSYPFKCNFCEC
jgi:hypothetical protein